MDDWFWNSDEDQQAQTPVADPTPSPVAKTSSPGDDWFWQSQPEVEKTAAPDQKTNQLLSGVLGLGQGATAAFGDEAAGAVGAGLDFITDPKTRSLAGLLQAYRESRDYARRLNEKAKSDNPWTYGIGEVTGGVASTAPFGAATGTIKGATTLGGAYGLGGSDADLTRGEVGGALMDTGKGALIGGATAGLIKAAPTAARYVGGKLRDYSDEIALKALGGNKAAFQDQIKRGTNLGRRALDEGIIGPFSSPETMLERSQLLKQEGGGLMDQAFQKADEVGASFDPWETGRKFYNESGDFYRSPINRDLASQLENTTEAIRMGVEPGEKVLLSEAQKLKDELSRVGYPKGQTPLNPTEKQLMAQDAVRTVKDAITESADSLLGPEGKQILQRGRSMYGTGAGSEKLLQGKIASEQAQGGGGIYDLLKKPLEMATSPQLKAWTGDKLSKVLQSSPQSLGKFGPMLQQVAQRGPIAINAAAHVLFQQSREFRDLQRQLNGQETPNQ